MATIVPGPSIVIGRDVIVHMGVCVRGSMYGSFSMTVMASVAHLDNVRAYRIVSSRRTVEQFGRASALDYG